MAENLQKINNLLGIMQELREKCPWDREQTMLTLRNNTIEECFELAEAILSENPVDIREELGDVLLHVVFYSIIAQENGWFSFDDVVDTLCEKLIYRHPHIYSSAVAENSAQVKRNWEALKQQQKQKKNKEGGLLSGVPSAMPALPKALRISQKAASVGFDWADKRDVWAKVREEIKEVEMEIENHDHEKMEEEFGDLLFALTNAARKYGVDPETALERTNRKFIERFGHIEKGGKPLSDMTLDEMEQLWQEAKSE